MGSERLRLFWCYEKVRVLQCRPVSPNQEQMLDCTCPSDPPPVTFVECRKLHSEGMTRGHYSIDDLLFVLLVSPVRLLQKVIRLKEAVQRNPLLNISLLEVSRWSKSLSQVSLSSMAVTQSDRADAPSANSTSNQESNMNRVKLGSESIECPNRNSVWMAGILNVFIRYGLFVSNKFLQTKKFEFFRKTFSFCGQWACNSDLQKTN